MRSSLLSSCLWDGNVRWINKQFSFVWMKKFCLARRYLFISQMSISQATASWFAIWRVGNPPSSLWSGQASMMCSIDCSFPHVHSGPGQLPRLWRPAKHGSCPLLKWLSVDQITLGRLVPGTSWLGFVTRCLLGASTGSHSSCQTV